MGYTNDEHEFRECHNIHKYILTPSGSFIGAKSLGQYREMDLRK